MIKDAFALQGIWSLLLVLITILFLLLMFLLNCMTLMVEFRIDWNKKFAIGRLNMMGFMGLLEGFYTI
jgi:hypothetical protein